MWKWKAFIIIIFTSVVAVQRVAHRIVVASAPQVYFGAVRDGRMTVPLERRTARGVHVVLLVQSAPRQFHWKNIENPTVNSRRTTGRNDFKPRLPVSNR